MNKDKVKLAIAPIGWTNDDIPELGKENTFEQCVSEMALAGYTGSEVGNKYPTDTDKLNKALKLRGLTICNSWFSTFLISKPFEETKTAFLEKVDFLDKVGAKIIGVSEQSHSIQGKPLSIFDEKYVMNEDEWKLLADGLNQLGKLAKDRGFKLTFHHHMGTVVQTAEETDKLMQMTNPEYVYLLLDTGHFSYCNEDPVRETQKHVKRIGHVHLKDIRPGVIKDIKAGKKSFLEGVSAGTFTVPGDGAIDFEPIFKILADNNYEGWMVVEAEQDPAVANPLEYAIKGREYIRKTAGI